uniref:Uncharacterized protein n=1 Tax=Arundo donax TaxID=35708 RepID=A0A0A9CRY2_ARUDO
MILVISDSCKYCHVPEQIAEKPTELERQFVAAALSLAQRAPKLSPSDPLQEDRYVILGTRSPGSIVCGPLLNN